MTIVFQGDLGGSGEAAARAFDASAKSTGRPSFRHVFDALASGEAKRAVLPTEHSRGGSEPEVLDALLALDGFRIVGERWMETEEETTRFVLLAPEGTDAETGEAMKTTLVFAPRAEVPNALFRSLTAFVGRRLRVYKVEPQPRGGEPGAYRYIVDVEGDPDAEPLSDAFEDLPAFNDEVRILGTYAAAEIPER